jgi:NADH/NAD ratio-sensing transcriptional regulator Rex
LEKLKGNRWFKAGVKVAIAIGDDANNDVLREFTGSSESVITVHNVDQLKKMIHTVSVSATTVASQSASVGAAMVTQNQLVAQSISNTVANDASLSGVDVGSSTANSGSEDWSGWN